MSDVLSLLREVKHFELYPIGIIINKELLKQIRIQTDILSEGDTVGELARLQGLRLYPFEDIPEESLFIFNDKRKLDKYLELRGEEGMSHNEALSFIQLNFQY